MSTRMCITGFNLWKLQTLLSAGDSKTKDQVYEEAAKHISDESANGRLTLSGERRRAWMVTLMATLRVHARKKRTKPQRRNPLRLQCLNK